MPSKSASTRKANSISFRTRSSSSPRDRDTSRFGKSLCIFPASRLRRRGDRLIRECRPRLLEWQLETEVRRVLPNLQFARVSMPRPRKVRFFVAGAGVDLQMLVAYAAGYVAAKFVAAEFAARVSIIEANLAAGPNQRGFFHRHRFGRRIIFSVFRILYCSRNGGSLFPWL